ncbi:unnamed protein product, partial [Heterosigma akashiwo]
MGGAISLGGSKYSPAQRAHWLRKSPLFLRMSEKQILKVAEQMQTKKYPLGSKVEVSEHRILIVGSGELKVSMALPSEKKKVESELFLCTKKPGDIVNIAATKKNASARMKHAKLADFFADVEITTCTETV